jgi:undecaprenyl-diphosphatase
MTNVVNLVILGIVQGVTEFLPISSSAHNEIFQRLLNFHISLEYELILNIGSLIALLIFFRKKIFEILKSRKIMILILASLIVPVVIGISGIGDKMEEISSSITVISIMLILVGIFMYLAEKFQKKVITIGELTPLKAFIIGIFESLAFFKGTSRSGVTISASLASGLSKVDAAEFSFIIGIPLLAAATLSGVYKLTKTGIPSPDILPLLAGFISSLIFSLISIRFLLNYLKSRSFNVFIVYRLVLAVILLLFFR